MNNEEIKIRMKLLAGLKTRFFHENLEAPSVEQHLGCTLDDLTNDELLALTKVIDTRGDLMETVRDIREHRETTHEEHEEEHEEQHKEEHEEQHKEQTGTVRGISQKQLDYLLLLLTKNDLHYTIDDLTGAIGKAPERLTSEEASLIIDALKKGNRDKLDVALNKVVPRSANAQSNTQSAQQNAPVPRSTSQPTTVQPTTVSELSGYSPEEIQIIRDHIARGATDAELKYFLYIARLRGLNPILKEIYWVRRHMRDRETGKWINSDAIMIGIDGARKIAERSGRVDGIDVAITHDETGQIEYGVATLWLKGSTHPYIARAKFSEYEPHGEGASPMWKTMPEVMIKKVAEMLVYRMAFAAELGGLYIREEMDQA
jgi:phage recombination protein Bet